MKKLVNILKGNSINQFNINKIGISNRDIVLGAVDEIYAYDEFKDKDKSINDRLVDILESYSEEDKKIEAMYALGKSSDVRAVDPMLKILDDSVDPKTRRIAAVNLGRLKAKKAIPTLIKHLCEVDGLDTPAACKNAIVFDIIPSLNENEIVDLCKYLIDYIDSGIQKYIPPGESYNWMTASDDANWERCSMREIGYVMRACRKKSNKVYDLLFEETKRNNVKVRKFVWDELSQNIRYTFDVPKIIPDDVISLSQEQNRKLLDMAVATINSKEDNEIKGVIIENLCYEDPHTSNPSVYRYYKSTEIVPVLIENLPYSINYLGELRDSRAVPDLCKITVRGYDNYKYLKYRKEAIIALGKINDPFSMSSLNNLLSDEDSEIRALAIKTITEMNSKNRK